MKNAPIALFTFNRFDKFKATLECLMQCEGILDSPLYIFIDGAISQEDFDRQKEILKCIEVSCQRLDYKVIESSFNKGLKRSILEGIDMVFDQHDRIVVLEDDIQVARQFLSAMNSALDRFQSDPAIMHINGYQQDSQDVLYYQLTDYMSCWGWATWKESWKALQKDSFELIKNLVERKYSWLRKLPSNIDKHKQFLATHYRVQNTWAILWQYSIWLAKGQVVTLSMNMVNNDGDDDSGEHDFSSYTLNKTLDSFSIDDLNKIEIKENKGRSLNRKEIADLYLYEKSFLLSEYFGKGNLIKNLMFSDLEFVIDILKLRLLPRFFPTRLGVQDALQSMNRKRMKINNSFYVSLEALKPLQDFSFTNSHALKGSFDEASGIIEYTHEYHDEILRGLTNRKKQSFALRFFLRSSMNPAYQEIITLLKEKEYVIEEVALYDNAEEYEGFKIRCFDLIAERS